MKKYITNFILFSSDVLISYGILNHYSKDIFLSKKSNNKSGLELKLDNSPCTDLLDIAPRFPEYEFKSYK